MSIPQEHHVMGPHHEKIIILLASPTLNFLALNTIVVCQRGEVSNIPPDPQSASWPEMT